MATCSECGTRAHGRSTLRNWELGILGGELCPACVIKRDDPDAVVETQVGPWGMSRARKVN